MGALDSLSRVEEPERVRAWEALRYRDFRRFWFGALVSNTGTWMQRVTVPFVLYHLTGSASWVGFAAFMQFLPGVLLGPVGGSLADRYPRRRILVVTQILSAVLSGALWWLWVSDLATPGAIVVVVVGLGAVFGINAPAWQAFVSELVPRDVLLNAVTLNSTQFNASRAVGPAVAGIVLATLGAGWAFLINAVSYAAVVLALVLVRPASAVVPRGDRARPVREMIEAARHAVREPGILASLVTVTALGFFGGPLVQLLVVFAEEVFGVGDLQYGMLGAVLGVGAILGAPFIAGPGSGMRRSTLLRVSVSAYAVSLVVFGLAPGYLVALGSLLVSGAGWLAIASTLNTTIQLQVDERMRGKVLALYLMLLTTAMPVGSLLQGWLAEVAGPRATVTGAGLAFLAVWAALALGTDLLPHVDADGAAEAGDLLTG